ncbi:MAG: helix-turn-helix domain-containing protein [Acutalibacteraceae bacterium]
MEINYISIGARIRQFRKEKGWTQAVLAEKSGIEPSNISHIERGATKLSLPTLVSIANALEVTTDELVYASLVKREHILTDSISSLLSDCNGDELQAIEQMITVTKNILRKTK